MNLLRIIGMVPLFLVLLLIYFIVVLAAGGSGFLENKLFTVDLISGSSWSLSTSHIFLILGVITLYVELVKATSTGTATVIEHALSMIVFISYLVLFLLVAPAGNSTFFLLMMMSLLDVVAGFTITIIAARRDFAVGHPGGEG